MGLKSGIISAVGHDELGEAIVHAIREKDLVDLIQRNKYPTGTVSVTLQAEGIPEYIIHEDVAWDHIRIDKEALKYADKADAICFGSLAQRSSGSRKTIREIITATRPGALRVFDINLRQQFYDLELIRHSLKLATILKINDEEIALLADMMNLNGNEFDIVSQIIDTYQLDYLALTKGSRGSWLFNQQNSSYVETPKVEVVDTVGAGDSFTAAFVAGLLTGLPLEEVHQFAVDISAFVCTRRGGTPPLPQELVSKLYP
jgi:fructokinase